MLLAIGDATADSVVLLAAPTALGPVHFEVDDDADLASPLVSTSVDAVGTDLPVKLDVSGLLAGTPYFVRATDAAGRARTGRFRTPAAPGARRGLRFGVSGDWRGELAPYPSVANVPSRDLDFFVELGDTIYADFPSPAVPAAQASTVAQYRAKHHEAYAPHLGLEALGAIRRNTVVYAMLDDHEVTNDFAGGAPAGSDARFSLSGGETFLSDTTLFAHGLDAFVAWNPIRDETWSGTNDPDAPGSPDPRMEGRRRLYRARRFGDDAVLLVVDARSFRSEPIADVLDPNDTAGLDAFFRATYGLDTTLDTGGRTRTFLGASQVQALEADLLAAQSDGVQWKFVLVPEPIQNLAPFAASDRYEGYARERDALLRFVAEQAVTNVVFVAADIHGTLVNDLSYQIPPDVGPGQPRYDVPGAFEITTGPVAFDAPFGPTVVDQAVAAGLITPAERTAYRALSMDQKDALLHQTYDDLIATPPAQGGLGLDPLGLAAAKATLLEGDWVRVNAYGWTELSIDASTGRLEVTTYGIDPYTANDLLRDPGAVITRAPRVIQRFVLDPTP